MRFKQGIIISSLLLASMLWFVPSQVRAQVTCGATSVKQTFPGGHIVERMCNNRLVSGVGSDLIAAQSNLSNLTKLMPQKSCSVSNSDPIAQFAGGFRTTFRCTDIYGAGNFVSGVGSTATDAGLNALSFAQLYIALNDVACVVNNYNVTGFTGGFKVDTNCHRFGHSYEMVVTGIGSTATDAGENSRGFAELVGAGLGCLMTQPVTFSGGLFHAFYSCNGRPVQGHGSTVTAAGNDALINAQLR